MPDLQVDLDGLASFARRLDRIRDALADAQEVLRGYDDALGDGSVDAYRRADDDLARSLTTSEG